MQKLGYLKDVLTENREKYAELITQEVGKPINQSFGEIDKSIKHIDYYIKNSERWLHDEHLDMLSHNDGKIIH